MKYDYFIAGRTRNRAALQQITKKLRNAGFNVFCFIENKYEGDGVRFNPESNDPEEEMKILEAIKDWRNNKTFKKIYEGDMQALRDSQAFILVFPGGLSSHMELGAAFGMGKKCYGLGEPEKPETLYFMFEEIYSDVESFVESKAKTEVEV
jgi:hypothetical protein